MSKLVWDKWMKFRKKYWPTKRQVAIHYFVSGWNAAFQRHPKLTTEESARYFERKFEEQVRRDKL